MYINGADISAETYQQSLINKLISEDLSTNLLANWEANWEANSLATNGKARMPVNDDNLIWVDLEMTGLDPDSDTVIEIATIVTDAQLNILAEGPVFAIQCEPARLDAMDEWNQTHHGASGLLERVHKSQHNMLDAEEQTIEFLKDWVSAGKSPMCGNSICQDRRFMVRTMPELETFFHYRNIDVSTIKELVRRWQPDIASSFKKKNTHLALDDIRESIAELQIYREKVFSI